MWRTSWACTCLASTLSSTSGSELIHTSHDCAAADPSITLPWNSSTLPKAATAFSVAISLSSPLTASKVMAQHVKPANFAFCLPEVLCTAHTARHLRKRSLGAYRWGPLHSSRACWCLISRVALTACFQGGKKGSTPCTSRDNCLGLDITGEWAPGVRCSDDAKDVHEGVGHVWPEGLLVHGSHNAQAVHRTLPHVCVLVLAALQQVRQGIAQVFGSPYTHERHPLSAVHSHNCKRLQIQEHCTGRHKRHIS